MTPCSTRHHLTCRSFTSLACRATARGGGEGGLGSAAATVVRRVAGRGAQPAGAARALPSGAAARLCAVSGRGRGRYRRRHDLLMEAVRADRERGRARATGDTGGAAADDRVLGDLRSPRRADGRADARQSALLCGEPTAGIRARPCHLGRCARLFSRAVHADRTHRRVSKAGWALSSSSSCAWSRRRACTSSAIP